MQPFVKGDSVSCPKGEGTLLLTSIALVTMLGSIAVLTITGPGSFSGMATAVQNSSTTNVTLEISEQTIVSVEPASYNFSGMTLGSTNFSDVPALQLIIRNDGSSNITNIYAHPDTLESEQNNPLGSGQAQEYASGRFLWIQNDTSGWYHASGLTWNRTEDAGGTPSGLAGENENGISYGFYRNATGDYLWELSANGTSGGHNGYCNTSSAGPWEAPVLTIKNEKDDGSNRNLGSNTATYTLSTNNSNWAESKVSGGPLDDHYVASYRDCSKIYVYRFDSDTGFPTSGKDKYLLNSDNKLTPGDEFNGRVGAAVPTGVPAGKTNQTILTITASSTVG